MDKQRVPVVCSDGVTRHYWKTVNEQTPTTLSRSQMTPPSVEMARVFDPITTSLGEIIGNGYFPAETDGDCLHVTIPSHEAGGLLWETMVVSDLEVRVNDDGSAVGRVELTISFDEGEHGLTREWLEDNSAEVNQFLENRYGLSLDTGCMDYIDDGLVHCFKEVELDQDDTFAQIVEPFDESVIALFIAEETRLSNAWSGLRS